MPGNEIVIRTSLPIAIATWAGLACQLPPGRPATPAYPDHTRLLIVRDSAGTETTVRTPADWQVRRAHILANLQAVMGTLPGGERRVPLDVKLTAEVDEPAYLRRKIDYASEPADRVPAWLLIPKGERTCRPAMICLHQTVAIGKDEPVGLGGKENLRYGLELAERGYVVLAPDYPNFGEHNVDPYALGYASASMKAIWDNMRGVDLLASLPEVDPGRIGVIGHSLGGHNAIFTAVFDDRLRAVVSSCGFNSFPYYFDGKLAGWSHKGYMPRIQADHGADPARVPFDFPELIGALAPRAFFTNSPLRDANFAVEGVRVCVDSAGDVYRLYRASERLQAVYPEAEHDFPLAERERTYRFLDRMLEPVQAAVKPDPMKR
jgi:acetyl esterase/lipase